jgi:hypothetical protein
MYSCSEFLLLYSEHIPPFSFGGYCLARQFLPRFFLPFNPCQKTGKPTIIQFDDVRQDWSLIIQQPRTTHKARTICL